MKMAACHPPLCPERCLTTMRGWLPSSTVFSAMPHLGERKSSMKCESVSVELCLIRGIGRLCYICGEAWGGQSEGWHVACYKSTWRWQPTNTYTCDPNQTSTHSIFFWSEPTQIILHHPLYNFPYFVLRLTCRSFKLLPIFFFTTIDTLSVFITSHQPSLNFGP